MGMHDDISTRPALSLAKTAAGLSLDRNVRPSAALSRTLPGSKAKGTAFSMPKSTVESVRSTRQAFDATLHQAGGRTTDSAVRAAPLAAAPRGAGVSCSTGTDSDLEEGTASLKGGLDIFGMKWRGVVDEGEDDFVDDADGGDGGGFWMPGASLPTPPRSARSQPREQPRAQGPKEFYDGYNLWHEWESRKAGKPFWHCKETGETRWEKPTYSAVQQVRFHVCIQMCTLTSTHTYA
jgi:hypothetical protein